MKFKIRELLLTINQIIGKTICKVLNLKIVIIQVISQVICLVQFNLVKEIEIPS
jgi:hypothetical protein